MQVTKIIIKKKCGIVVTFAKNFVAPCLIKIIWNPRPATIVGETSSLPSLQNDGLVNWVFKWKGRSNKGINWERSKSSPPHVTFDQPLDAMCSDDARKSTVSYTINTCSQWHLHNTKRNDLTESTGVVPAKYPPKIKLELLTTLEC